MFRAFLITTAAVIGISVAAGGIAFISGNINLGLTGYFQPRYEAVRNQTFHESQSYNDGMVRDLENLRMEYMTATDDQKVTLRGVILHRFSVYPIDKMPNDLRVFYLQIQSGN